MSTIFLEKDADYIYEQLEEKETEDIQDEYREDRMEQMISKYGYWNGGKNGYWLQATVWYWKG